MTNQPFQRQYIAFCVSVLFLFSCNKMDEVSVPAGVTNNKVSFADPDLTGLKKIAIEFQKVSATFIVTEINRDITTEADLQKKVNIILTDDTAAVRAKGLTPLPSTFFTINKEATLSAGKYSLSLKAGEASGHISITIPDGTLLNPNVNYGLAFTLNSVAGEVLSAKTFITQVNVKSKLDGRYHLKGFHNRTAPILNEPYDEEVYLITTGANSVKMYWPAVSLDAHPLQAGTTFYADFSTEFLFDLSTNKLSGIVNAYNNKTTSFSLPASGNSRYEPSTKTIFAQYYFNNNSDRMFTDTLVYLGTR